LRAAHDHEIRKLLYLGSSCIYPKMAEQPIKENALLSGYLEPTNKAYAIAKIAGLTLCQAYWEEYGNHFISAMPTNLYGINDNFDLESSHVLPALIRKFHDAKINNKSKVTLWGTGSPKREFLCVDDCADACIFLMENYDELEIVNVGSGEEISIKELAKVVQRVVGYDGEIVFDSGKPDGTPRKFLDTGKINNLGWSHKISLEDGISNTYNWFLLHVANAEPQRAF